MSHPVLLSDLLALMAKFPRYRTDDEMDDVYFVTFEVHGCESGRQIPTATLWQRPPFGGWPECHHSKVDDRPIFAVTSDDNATCAALLFNAIRRHLIGRHGVPVGDLPGEV